MTMFYKNFWHRPLLSCLLILCLIAGFYSNIFIPVKKADAIFANTVNQIAQTALDTIGWALDNVTELVQEGYQAISSAIDSWFQADTIAARVLKEVWNITRKTLLNQLANDIIKWAQNGGDFAFVMDWNKFLGGLVEQVGSDLIVNELGMGNLCDPFDGLLKNIFQNQYFYTNTGSPFAQQTKCPLLDTAMNGFMNDFNQGGWDAWAQMIQPSGNYFGAIALTNDELMKRTGEEYDTQKTKLLANQGAKGDDTKGTPGILQSYAMQRTSTLDLDYLLQSNDAKEFFSSVTDAFVNRMIKEGLSSMQTDTYHSAVNPPDYNNMIPPESQDLIYIQTNILWAEKTSDRFSLIQGENALNSLLTEQQYNFSLMGSVRSAQLQIISGLNQLKNATSVPPCSLPSWANQYSNIPPIETEYNQLSQQISQTQQKISQAGQLVTSLNNLTAIMERAIQADKNNNQSALSAELNNFKTAQPAVISLIQSFLGTQETDFQKLYDEANKYLQDIPNQLKQYIDPDVRGTADDVIMGGPTLQDQIYTENARLVQLQSYLNLCPAI